MGKSATVLIVDDDEELGQLLSDRLGRYGFSTAQVHNGNAMLAWLESHSCDLILLDIMLPGEDGLALCRKLKAINGPLGNIPIIFTSALGDVSDRVVGLEMGADDYVPKPFDTRELTTRIRTVLRRSQAFAGFPSDGKSRSQGAQGNIISFGAWKLDISSHNLIDDKGIVVPLSSTEYRLLRLLLDHQGKVLSRDEILRHLGGRAAENYDRSVDVQINRLRGKLRDSGKAPGLIRTVRGDGYRLDIDVERS